MNKEYSYRTSYFIIILNKMGCEATKNSNIQPFTDKTVLSLNKIYERMELIGSGTYGKVYRCINKLDNNEYALKVV